MIKEIFVITATRYTLIFTLVASIFLPLYWFFFFTTYISPISGVLFSEILSGGLSLNIVDALFASIPYLIVFTCIGRRIHHKALSIVNRRRRFIFYIFPLLLIFGSSFLPVLRHDGWSGNSANYSFWGAADCLLNKIGKQTEAGQPR